METLATGNWTRGDINSSNPDDYIVSENDIYLDTSGNIAMFYNLEATMDVLSHVARTLRFELQYNMNKGIPYMQTIFKDATRVALWKAYMEEAILNVDNVNAIETFDIEYDGEQQILKYTARIQTTYGTGVING